MPAVPLKPKISFRESIQRKKKPNLTQDNLNRTQLADVDESKLTPLWKFIATLIKARELRKLKYRQSRNFKSYKGPRPKRHTKEHRRNFAKIFRFSFFNQLSKQKLYRLFLKRFFKWYFLLSNTELKALKNRAKSHKNRLFFFISLFERRAANILIRTGISTNPIVTRFLFTLGCVRIGTTIVYNPQTLIKVGQILFLRNRFVPYSLYRYYINFWRADYIISEMKFFLIYRQKAFFQFKRRVDVLWIIRNRLVKKFTALWFKNFNWTWRYIYIIPRSSICCLIRIPRLSDFTSFIFRYNLVLYRQLFFIA